MIARETKEDSECVAMRQSAFLNRLEKNTLNASRPEQVYVSKHQATPQFISPQTYQTTGASVFGF